MSNFKSLTTTFADPGNFDIGDANEVHGDDIDANTMPFDIEDLCEHKPAQGFGGIIRCAKCNEVLGFARQNFCGND